MIALLCALLVTSPAFTPEEMDDMQNHAEAALRLHAGVVLRPNLELPSPPWAFAPMASNAEPFEF